MSRRAVYRALTEAGYSVVAFDYRGAFILPPFSQHKLSNEGFGDSPGTPTEEGAAADVEFVYRWAVRYAGDNPVYLWGHSLGTGCVKEVSFRIHETFSSPLQHQHAGIAQSVRDR